MLHVCNKHTKYTISWHPCYNKARFFFGLLAMERIKIFNESGLKLFAQRLKEVRKLKNFTQEELAYQSGLTLSQIARIETARINPTLSTIFKIATTMDVKLVELFDFELPKE